MAVSSIGVGSGLPLAELLKNLETNERQALTVYTSRATAEQTRLSAYGTIKSGIEALQKAAETLGKADTFGALKTSTTSEAFSATAKTGAIAGQYNIQVKQLATSQSLQSKDPLTSRKDALSTEDASITVTLGNGKTTTLSLSKDETSLDGIVKAINNNTEIGVSATLVNSSSDPDNPSFYLLLNARGTGEQASVSSITVTGTDSQKLNDTLGFDKVTGGALKQDAAKNAEVTVNGITVSSQTNTVEGAIDGVTLTLNKKNTEAETLSITADSSVTEKAINAFVTAYNNIQNTIKSLTSYNTETQTGSALTGDSIARRVQTQISQALFSATGANGLNLSGLGITTDPTNGNLKVDNTKLTAALKDRMPDVKALFSGENGVSKTIEAAAQQFVKADGILSSATDSITRTIKSLEQQYISASARIDARMENYQKQFQQLDVIMAQMNSTSTYLTQQLSALANMNNSNNK